jgi:hypothetical protein
MDALESVFNPEKNPTVGISSTNKMVIKCFLQKTINGNKTMIAQMQYVVISVVVYPYFEVCQYKCPLSDTVVQILYGL